MQSINTTRHDKTRISASVFVAAITMLLSSAGCGVTRRTDTTRTASEQLLISNAVDQAVAQLDFGPLAGKSVYFDPQFLAGTVDEHYVVSTLRQHLLHHGCVIQADKAKAQYVVEARAGAIGTDRHDITVGVPAVNLPATVAATGVPPVIPEIPFAKSTDQKGVAKLAVFAYEQESGRRVWQSGVAIVTSDAKDTWILGMGPFQRGSIYDGTNFVGAEVLAPFGKGDNKKHKDESGPNRHTLANVTGEVLFTDPRRNVTTPDSCVVPAQGAVVQAGHMSAIPGGSPVAAIAHTSPPSSQNAANGRAAAFPQALPPSPPATQTAGQAAAGMAAPHPATTAAAAARPLAAGISQPPAAHP